MLYRKLPSAETMVSALCLGTMTFGGQTQERESTRIVEYALDHGVNFLDTANIYNGGDSGKGAAGKTPPCDFGEQNGRAGQWDGAQPGERENFEFRGG